MNYVDSSMGAGLAAARKRAGVSSDALAEKLGIDAAQVSDWEAGARRMKPEDLIAVARCLDIPLRDLFEALRDESNSGKGLDEQARELREPAGINTIDE